MTLQRVQVIDTHTGGEPTRVVIAGGPDLSAVPPAERPAAFLTRHDQFRSGIVNEPRGSDVMVGALLMPPAHAACAAGVVFFNNVGALGMCGHGTIGVVVALGHLGRIAAGRHLLETPVGIVAVDYDGKNTVSFENVPSYRHIANATVQVPGIGNVTGDVAWGGNWFFLAGEHAEHLSIENVDRLTDVTWRIRRALTESGIAGANGAEIDHIELFGPPSGPNADSKNFVLCPGKAYDRSPCGTGTSAKLACLIADGKLAPGQVWRQESIVGSIFEGSVRIDGNRLIPRITGSAFVTGEATLIFDPADPFRQGIRP